MKTKLALLGLDQSASHDRSSQLRRHLSFVSFVFFCLISVAFSSARAGDDTTLAPPPVKYVEDFTNASTPKITAAKTWAVYPASEPAPAFSSPNANAAIVTNGVAAAAPGQPVTAPPTPATQAPTAPAATPPPADPDNVPNSFQASPSLQGAGNIQ